MMRILVLSGLPPGRVGAGPEPLFSALPSDCQTQFFGPGRERFAPGLSFQAIVRRFWRHGRPDWVVLPDHDQLVEFPSGLERSPIPRLLWIDDAHHGVLERIRYLRRVRPKLALFTQWHTAGPYAPHLDGRPLWSPHGVDPEIFQGPVESTSPGSKSSLEQAGEEARPIDLLLFGALDARNYPFRYRLARLLRRMTDLHVRVVPHPGYRPTIDPRRELARELIRAKVVLLDPSRYGLLLLRYFEVPAAGALGVGEMPAAYEDRLAPLMLPLDPNRSDRDLEAALRGILEDYPRYDPFRKQATERVRSLETWRERGRTLSKILAEV